MGKLIELLNEFEKVKTWYATYTTRCEKSERELKSDYMYDEDQNIIQIYIISKSFGFIKWLVDNDKIDLLKLTCINPRYTEILDSDFSWEDRIIMLLSIQDEPISFLISILK